MKNDNENKLADFDDSIVKEKAEQLTEKENSIEGKITKLFYYVRDDIKFGFVKKGDFMKASETIRIQIGQCNNKTTLFLALCKALHIPARIHFSLIKKEIQKGIFPAWLFWLLPNQLSHSWLEVEVNGAWRKIDAYINDTIFYEHAKKILERKHWNIGYSMYRPKNATDPADFDLSKERFEQMGATTDDHGVWNDPMDYYMTSKYQNHPNMFTSLVYSLFLPYINQRIEKVRSDSLC